MSRIPLFPTDDTTAAQRAVYDAVVAGPRGKVEGPLRAALHNPELAERWQQLGAILRYGTSLTPRLSELAILVTARETDAQFEWYAHEKHALAGGLDPTIIDSIRRGERPAFTRDDEAAVFDFARELHRDHRVSEPTYQRAFALLGTTALVELTGLIGYYTMVAMTLNAHEIPLPAGVEAPLPAR